MPSPLHVPVAIITTIKPHPNAEKLEIAEILGWQCVVQKARFKAGDACVYFPPDTMLPKEISDSFGVTQYLDKGRIKATRLRGEPSFGLVMPYDILPPPTDVIFVIGEDVADYFGATKYEPPVREQRTRDGKVIENPFGLPRDPLFPEFTHISNLRHYPDLIGSDELVIVTEKLHGTNSRIGMIDGQWMAGSHRVRRGEGDALYWSPRKHAETLVSALAKHHRQVVLFGEILGNEVQSLDYGFKGHEGYRAFDLMIDGRYIDYLSFERLCIVYCVPMVPKLFVGEFRLQIASASAKGVTLLNADHLREGVVVKPLIERSDPRIGRVILKYVSDDFLLAKKSDFTEE